MKYLLCFCFAASFVGAQCESPTPLTRSCSGSTVQTAYFYAQTGCPGGSAGYITVSVPTAGQCALSVTEPTAVGLPTTGTFGESAGGTSSDLSKGNWNLEPPPTGTQIDQAETYLTCTGGAALPGGDITLTCSITSCTQEGDDDDYSCNLMGSCQVQLAPSSADAASMVPVVDASVANHDAGTSRDGG